MNPRDVKFLLGEELVERFHDKAAAVRACERFIKRFQKGGIPDEMPEVSLASDPSSKGVPIGRALKEAGLALSASEAFQTIKQGACVSMGSGFETEVWNCPREDPMYKWESVALRA